MSILKQPLVNPDKTQDIYQTLVKTIPDMIFHLHKDGTFLNFRPSTKMGPKPLIPPEQFIGKKMSGIMPKNVTQPFLRLSNEAIKKGRVQSFEYRLPYDKINFFDFEARIVPINKNEVICIVRDITEVKNIEKQMHEMCEAHSRNIGQNLHDSLSQNLTGIAFMAKGLEKKLANKNLDETKEISLIIQLVNNSINQTRHLAQGLHPLELKSNDLGTAIKELALETEKIYKIPCLFKSIEDIKLKDSQSAIHLYRITQEAITNAIKHSKPSSLKVTLKSKKDGLVLSVMDNGSGIPKFLKNNKGIGIKIMHHRAQMIGATLEIKNTRAGGTIVTCYYPFHG